ncbi:hypothetical protein CSV80_10525 [Sporosarcina sp. P12(2017)]|uniref:YusW family protein n=1 Tax=unclassified Sporosarcina TaxID=2647733 RepID=UPI000C16BC27|nr:MULTISPECIES: YusW family protein [unclassified Sporosarcina]PIC57135.1 hypothetical protein CSV81_10855 [Sporosarcina sp. P10]PIC60517.1 hypothetical protein CSV80_10525 [Sporosarcina sp. P12(2017)]
MKRLVITGASVIALALAGCGTNATDDKIEENSNAVNPPAEQPLEPATDDTNQNTDEAVPDTTTDSSTDSTTGDMQAEMDKLSFKEIELDVSYGKDKEYEAEIEQDQNEPIKAKVEDELNEIYLKGQEAFDDVYSKVKNLDVTKDSSQQETIDRILKAFNLQADYEKFEVKIKFNDGSKLEVEDRK